MSAPDERPTERKPFTRRDAARLCVTVAALAFAIPLMKIVLGFVVDLALEGRSLAEANARASHYISTNALHDVARFLFAQLVFVPVLIAVARPELFARKPVEGTRAPNAAVLVATGSMIVVGALSTTLLFVGELHLTFAPPLSSLMDAYAAAVDAIAHAVAGPAQAALAALGTVFGAEYELDQLWVHSLITLLAFLASTALAVELDSRKRATRLRGAARWLVVVPALFFMFLLSATGPAVRTAEIYSAIALIGFGVGFYRLFAPAPDYTARETFRAAIPLASVAALTLVLLLADLALQ